MKKLSLRKESWILFILNFLVGVCNVMCVFIGSERAVKSLLVLAIFLLLFQIFISVQKNKEHKDERDYTILAMAGDTSLSISFMCLVIIAAVLNFANVDLSGKQIYSLLLAIGYISYAIKYLVFIIGEA